MAIDEAVKIEYAPWPKQDLFHRCPANEILYGGAAGPGKSHALRFDGLIWSLRIPNLHVYLFRRTYPELEVNHIIPSLTEIPRALGKYKEQKRRWEFINGSMLHFCHAQYEKDIFNYQGAEIHLLLIDELTTFTEFMYDYLRGRVRCTLSIPKKYKHKIPGIAAGTNPGGVGHEFAKRRWVTFTKKGNDSPKRASNKEGGMLRAYLPGKLEDNPSLTENDPTYIHRLNALPEPYRTAYKDGDWDIFIGQAFNFSYDHHVIKSFPVPVYAQIYMTFDWGFGKPFSVGWWWVDSDGRVYRFAEWYGWNGTPNMGCRMTDYEIAAGIKEKEKKMIKNGLLQHNDKCIRLAGPDCFSKKPDYKGGGQGPATSEEFAKQQIFISKGDPSRELKIRQFHERLRLLDDRPPMVQIYDTCEQFIRTIPLLQADSNNIEDIDTDMEDHIYDESCHVFMARPIILNAPKRPISSHDRRIEELEQGPVGDYEDYAIKDQIQTIRYIQGGEEVDLGEMDGYEDGDLRNTVE